MRRPGNDHATRGQMMVEMAVCLPVMLAVLGIVVNMLVFFGDCARFDRIAAEAVRSQAASPGYDAYGSTSRAQAVQSLIQASFADSDHLSFSVSASGGSSAGSATDGSGVSLSLLPHLETYTCRMDYRPWGFGGSFFGISFAGIPHTRVYVIDPYRPGVLL